MKYCCRLLLCKVIFSFLLLFPASSICAQTTYAMIKGKVVDSTTGQFLPAASIRFFEGQQKRQVSGNTSSETGDFSFELPFGTYHAIIEHTGYSAYTTAVFTLSTSHRNHD